MIFRNASKGINSLPKISINNVLIKCVSRFDLLDISISQTLNFKYHIDKIIMKTSRFLEMLCKLKHFQPLLILKTLHNSFLLQHFNYGSLAWGNCSNFKNPEKGYLYYNKFKFIYMEYTIINVLKFYFNYRHSLLPSYFISYNFKYHSSIHEHHTRSKHEIQDNKTRTNIAGKCLRHTTSKIV